MHIRDRVVSLRRVRAGDLRPNPRNWRTHPKAQREALQGVLAEIGYADALLAREVDGGLELIDGHLRAETTPDAEVPVLVLDVTQAEADKLLLTLDPLAAMAGSNAESLKALLASATTNSEAVAALFAGLARDAGVAALVAAEDDAPEPLKQAVTAAGDLWTLGGHRLLCGDSTKREDVCRLMDGQAAALLATDPPYLVDYTGERPEIAAGRPGKRRGGGGKDWSATYKEVGIKDADAFFRAVFTNALEVLAPKAAIYCWHAHKRQALIARVWEDLGILDHQQIVWVKPSAVFGRVFWHFRHEPCMMGWAKGSMPRHDDDHRFDSVWEINWEGKNRVVGNEHPTQKPVEIFARPMRKHTREGAVCFEPFSGSGSHLIAAEQFKRRCFAMELEPVFVDVAIRRWQAFTGKEAVLQATGESWRATAKARKVEVPAEGKAHG